LTEAHRRTTLFVLFIAATVTLYWAPLTALIRLALTQEHFSHVIVVPLISGSLFVRERRRIFSEMRTSWAPALILFGIGSVLYLTSHRYEFVSSPNDVLAISLLSALFVWSAVFVTCYGLRALDRGRFSAAIMLMMIPVPAILLEPLISYLQYGTAAVSEILFRLSGVAFLRSGLDFELPGLIVEVARECSGIRSSMALLITGLLAGHLFLASRWTKAILAILIIPLLVIKNAVRIVSISLLSIYVDPAFLTGDLHRRGGVIFFLLALVVMAAALLLLQRAERIGHARLHA
jgi:exosortase